MENNYSMFLNHPYFVELAMRSMIRELKNPVEKFIFVYVYILGNKQKEAAEALSIHETNVARHMKMMRIKLEKIIHCKEKQTNLKK